MSSSVKSVSSSIEFHMKAAVSLTAIRFVKSMFSSPSAMRNVSPHSERRVKPGFFFIICFVFNYSFLIIIPFTIVHAAGYFI